MFRSRKPGDSDYYEDVSFAESLRRGGLLRFRLYRMLVLAREERRKEGRGGEVWRVNRKLETSVPAWDWEAQSYQLTIYSQLYSLSQNNISLFPEVGLNLIINKWCLGSGFTQTLTAEVPSSGGYKSIFSIYFERLSFLPRVKFIVGSKTNIPAPDLIPRHAVRVWRLDWSTSQVRGREGERGKIIIYYLCQAGIIWLTEYEGGRLLGNVSCSLSASARSNPPLYICNR